MRGIANGIQTLRRHSEKRSPHLVLIERYPSASPVIHRDVRRCLLGRFHSSQATLTTLAATPESGMRQPRSLRQPVLQRQLDRLYDQLSRIEAASGRRNRVAAKPGMTPKQGRYVAFIHYYTKLHGRAPAEADMQRYFRVTPPTVHQMLLRLEACGLIVREPGVARSIRLLVPREAVPDLE